MFKTHLVRENWNLQLIFWYFHFSAGSITFLTACWLSISMLSYPSQNALSRRFKEKNFQKHYKFWPSLLQSKYLFPDSKFCRPNPVVKYWTFSFQLKEYLCCMIKDDARNRNVRFHPDLNRILKSRLKRNNRSKFPEK